MSEISDTSDNLGRSERFRVLPGLPPYGPPAIPFPEGWGRTGREGFVVEFLLDGSPSWVGNFRPGALRGVQGAWVHPNNRDVVVISNGDAWVVEPDKRCAHAISVAVDGVWEVEAPAGLVLSRQGLAFLRLGPDGLLWHTRRLSWDGFDEINFDANTLSGLAWSPVDDRWLPFKVDLRSGASLGGSFSDADVEGWERLHDAAGETEG